MSEDTKKQHFVLRNTHVIIIYEALKGRFEPDGDKHIKYKNPDESDDSMVELLRPQIGERLNDDHIRRVRDENFGRLKRVHALAPGKYNVRMSELEDKIKLIEGALADFRVNRQRIHDRLEELEQGGSMLAIRFVDLEKKVEGGGNLTVEDIHNEMLRLINPVIAKVEKLEEAPASMPKPSGKATMSDAVFTAFQKAIEDINARLKALEVGERTPTANLTKQYSELTAKFNVMESQLTTVLERVSTEDLGNRTTFRTMRKYSPRPPRQK